MNAPQASRGGIFPRLWAALFGSDAARLRERAAPAHWLSYVLIVAQSATVLLVFGHAEIPLLVARDLAVQVIAALAVFVLIASVFAADMAMLATLKRIPALARNRQRWQLREHVAYTVFVLATEAITLAVVLAALDAAPDRLTAATPLIAPGSAVFTAAIVLRVLLVSWSAVQLVIVRGRLPVLLSTLTATGREIVGAHVERKLAALSLDDLSLPAAFRTYAAMSKPPRRVRTVWNAWLVRREGAAEAEEERQVASVVDALDELEARSLLHSHPALPAPILPPAAAALPAHAPGAPVASAPAIAGKTPPAIAAPASASTGAHTSAHPAPDRDRPPTGPGAPTVAPVVPSPDEPDTNSGQLPAAWPWKTPPDEPEDPAEPPLLPAASALAPTDLRAARKMATEAARRARAFALLDADPRMSRKTLRKELRCSAQRANEVYAEWHHERIRQHTRQHANAAAQ